MAPGGIEAACKWKVLLSRGTHRGLHRANIAGALRRAASRSRAPSRRREHGNRPASLASLRLIGPPFTLDCSPVRLPYPAAEGRGARASFRSRRGRGPTTVAIPAVTRNERPCSYSEQKALERLKVLLQARAMLAEEPRSAPLRDQGSGECCRRRLRLPDLGSPACGRAAGGGLRRKAGEPLPAKGVGRQGR